MTRLLAFTLAAVVVFGVGGVAVSARELHRASTPHVRVVSTVTTEDLRPLLDASIAAADQAAKVCEGP